MRPLVRSIACGMVLAVIGDVVPTSQRWALIVDDDLDACELLGDVLARRGFRSRCVFNGMEAIELLDQLGHTREALPGVVVTDLLMPGIIGTSVIEFLQRDRRLSWIPIAIVTASPSLAPPGHLVLRKPVDVDALAAFLDQHLHQTTMAARRAAEA